MTIPKSFRAGYVALIGRPNVGKSTLLNTLLDFKLSIVSKKPQTTRKKVLGILNDEGHQVIFFDTPGILQPDYDLQVKMVEYIKEAISDADMTCLMTDISADPQQLYRLSLEFLPKNLPMMILLNKIDLVSPVKLGKLLNQYQELFSHSECYPVSAKTKSGVDKLLNVIKFRLPQHPAYFPPDFLSDANERFFIAEIIREKIFEFYQKEVPYSCHVDIENMKEKRGRKDFIQAIIYVDQPSQKGILIGAGGQSLKRIGEKSRKDIETFLERPVYLEIYVKVMKNWRKKMSVLGKLGF
jgi:GTP-binding protein Era